MTVQLDPTVASTPVPDWPAIAERVADDLRPRAADLDRRASFRSTCSAPCGRRATRALVPVELGGGGVSHATMGELLRIVARAEPSTVVALAMHSHLVAAEVWRHHHGIDANAVLARVAGGALLVSTGASDWVASNGSATPVEGGFRIAARKAPASGCEAGDVLVTSVRWADVPDGPQVIHCAVPFSADGLRIERRGTRWACGPPARTRSCSTTCRAHRRRGARPPGSMCGIPFLEITLAPASP